MKQTSHMLQTYVHAPEWPDYHTKEDFLLSAGYYPGGDLTKPPVDTMFDTFIFLASPGFHHDHKFPEEYGGCRRFTRAIIEQFYSVQFDETRNMGALEAAAAELSEKLDLPDYKVKVFLPYFNMLPTTGIFGEVKGRVLDFSKEEDRFAGVEWQLDEQIRRMHKYGHLKLEGFFYVTEGLIREEDEIVPTIKHANAYAEKKGYQTLWNPYNHWETQYCRWKELGFSICTQQINYFPLVDGHEQMNAQKKTAISETAVRTSMYDVCITMEWSCLWGESKGWKFFKEYMEGGILYGYMKRPYVNYQLDGGPRSIHSAACGLPYQIGPEEMGKEEYEEARKLMDIEEIRSLYGELYKFIKGNLVKNDIFWGKKQEEQ